MCVCVCVSVCVSVGVRGVRRVARGGEIMVLVIVLKGDLHDSRLPAAEH